MTYMAHQFSSKAENGFSKNQREFKVAREDEGLAKAINAGLIQCKKEDACFVWVSI